MDAFNNGSTMENGYFCDRASRFLEVELPLEGRESKP